LIESSTGLSCQFEGFLFSEFVDETSSLESSLGEMTEAVELTGSYSGSDIFTPSNSSGTFSP
jgi:hypothetical protein